MKKNQIYRLPKLLINILIGKQMNMILSIEKLRMCGVYCALFVFLFLGLEKAHGAQKRALLVGIGNYPEESGWGKTHSSNDVNAMETSIVPHGFSMTTKLIDQQATKQGVVTALEVIYKQCGPGDVFLFYFSGHGQLVKDQNADELDGYDEALVLYGAPRYYDKLYRNENHLLDEELSKIFNKIRLRLGSKGELLVIVETGFGWSASETEEFVHGGAKPLGENGKDAMAESMGLFETGILDDLPFAIPSNSYSTLIQLTATAVNKPSYEYEGNGIFTLAVTRAFEMKNDSTTYLDFFKVIVAESMAIITRQIPNIEGDTELKMFKHFINKSSSEYGSDHKNRVTKISMKELNILFELHNANAIKVKKEIGMTDWEKSFFRKI